MKLGDRERYTACLSLASQIFVACLLCSSPWPIGAVGNGTDGDYEALMAFRADSDVAQKLGTWKDHDPCEKGWYGVTCKNGRVSHLVLEGLQLAGKIDALVALDQLRVLSLKGNALNGSIPLKLSNWKSLKLLYLSDNQFSGPIPDSISALARLWRLDMSNNNLNGSISLAFNFLSNILTLRLENNSLSGAIPSLNLTRLLDFNVSHNHLSGSIPSSLSKFPVSSFQQNIALCGTPLSVCQITQQPSVPDSLNPLIVPSTPSSDPGSPRKMRKAPNKLSTGAIVAIVVGDVAVLSIITCFFLLYYWKKYSGQSAGKRSDHEKFVFSSSQFPVQVADADRGRLVFMDGRKQFDLEDLLRASAEMLGKGCFGTAYKAVLEDGSIVAVKRLKDVNSPGRREFEQHMELVGKLRHPNLICLRAYYYARDEKLLVYDYLPNGSLFSLLHGNRGPGRTPLDWTTRVKIALGAARGLAYIHQECRSQKMPHGNIKSSNVLLDKNGNGCISDFGLVMMANSSVVASRLVGYRAPEHTETKKVSQRADVYSFGVLLLEILTGKVPSQSNLQDDGVDLPKWVQSVVREEWTAEVFDLELMRYKNIEEEMVAVLQIAMSCVSQSPELRPKMGQVVKMIEDIGADQSPLRDDSFDSRSQSPSVSEGTSQ